MLQLCFCKVVASYSFLNKTWKHVFYKTHDDSLTKHSKQSICCPSDTFKPIVAHQFLSQGRKWEQTSLGRAFIVGDSPCCLVFDGTGMLLNSLTSRTLSTERRHSWGRGGDSRLCRLDRTKLRTKTHKLSVMGVEVHGLCASLYRGMDFIRWYMGGHAIRACRVCEARVKENSSTAGRVQRQCLHICHT